jgi:hypothetical protein
MRDNFDPSGAGAIRIPVRVKNGRIVYFYDNCTIDLKEGTIGELAIPDYAIKDQDLRSRLSTKTTSKLLGSGTKLLA